MAPSSFHQKKGSLVVTSNENRTAQRVHPHQEFNNGIVMSAQPLRDNQLFEVRIDKKVSTWSGSIEIGVTALDPGTLAFPSSATNLREGSWVMSGTGVLQDGKTLVEEYGTDLDQLGEGDRVGVMRTSGGELKFFVNGRSQGVAASQIPPQVHAVVDLYGKCAQISIVEDGDPPLSAGDNISCENIVTLGAAACAPSSDDPLRFHTRCGSLVQLSNDNRTAERRRPSDEFNNGVVMTHRSLRDDEWFELRIDELVNKWSGSIELGVTTHSPETLEFPATMTNMRSGTIMMSGSGILTNGKGSRREYGNYNLDELHEGDRIGVVRKSNGNLHYYINGMDQGVASGNVPKVVYGVVDLYGMTVKVTLLDHNESSHRHVASPSDESKAIKDDTNDRETERLLFHPRCGGRAVVVNDGRTARRPSALDGFNNAVVLTNRALRPDELFEVVLEQQVSKWTGSIDIGVTMFPPHLLEFPTTMTNVRSGTWVMTGCGVMHNGTEVIKDYCQNLDTLQVGDKVGVKRTSEGNLHFYINGVDQGVAAHNVPARVYGVIDLYGQAAQASVVDHSGTETAPVPELLLAVPSPSLALTAGEPLVAELRFSKRHGRNARVLNNGLTAVRPNAHGEFNFAIVISDRPLTDNQLFEVVIDQMVDRWSGSIEAGESPAQRQEREKKDHEGVTAIRPEDLEFPSTMTDITHDTWMLSGSTIMRNGNTVRNGYKCDLDQLGVGSRVGMMRDSDGCLHYFVNGEDQGVACRNIRSPVWAVIDLYGQCAQVSIVPQQRISPPAALPAKVASPEVTRASITPAHSVSVNHQFNTCCGKNVVLRNNNKVACRSAGFNNALVFSAAPLELEELFEVQVEQVSSVWAGALVLGLTTFAPEPGVPLPPTALRLPGHQSWLLVGSRVFHNGTLLRDNYGPSLHRLSAGERIGVQHCFDGTLRVHLNGEDLGPAASNLPKVLYAVLDLYGMLESVSLCSSSIVPATHSAATNYFDCAEPSQGTPSKERVGQEFHEQHGRNVRLRAGSLGACRTTGYDHGLLLSTKPLPRCQLFQVRIDRLNSKWSSSLQVGVVGENPEKLHFPLSALNLRKLAWVISGDSVYHNGTKVKLGYGPNLDHLQQGHTVGVLVDLEGGLHLYVNGMDQGVAARDLPPVCYALVDLYGQCEQVTIVESHDQDSEPEADSREKADIDNGVKEKRVKNLHNDIHAIKNCEYQNLCLRFKAMLGIPDNYFVPDMNLCYCETCHKIRGDEPYLKVGEPPRDYAVPFGWCRFPLRLPPRPDHNSVQQKWHVAYHGVPVAAVRKTLDHGQLLSPDKVSLCQPPKTGSRSKSENCESHSVCLSPTLRYAGCSALCPKHEFLDPKTSRQMWARTAFQVLVQPGSYTTHPARVGATSPTSSATSRNPTETFLGASELEWRTKERGATILHALLVRLEFPPS
ncbi:neuralized E3 ubiquitin protein ligase 4 isoform X3 [Dermacentor variabilis]|uniref:neuralized E3 ubiquitin protein ligase 4 isoform X3 n=1 Tax=Dermacentor variabilis TaxID=34621 RepID=UPI003F5BE2C4